LRRTLVHGKQLLLLVGNGDKFFGFLEGGGERLLADDYSAASQFKLWIIAVDY
jgi:hypothetical protein